MTYDSHRGVLVLFGGIDASNRVFSDTWEWDGTSWRQVSAVRPAAAYAHAMAYDPVRRRVVSFGGGAVAYTPNNQTWEWDGSVWTQRQFTTAPSPRLSPVMVWDAARARMLLHGGDSTAGLLSDLWDFDGVTWQRRLPHGGTQPSARHGSAFVYDSANRRVVLFSGYSGTTSTADTWTLEPITHAEFTPTGPGCAGPSGTPTLAAAPASLPWIGYTFTTEVIGLPTQFSVPALLLGFSNPNVAGLACRADCTLRAMPDLAFVLTPTGGRATWSIAVPDDLSLLGFNQLHAQVVVFAFPSLCVDSMSNGMQLTIGAR